MTITRGDDQMTSEEAMHLTALANWHERCGHGASYASERAHLLAAAAIRSVMAPAKPASADESCSSVPSTDCGVCLHPAHVVESIRAVSVETRTPKRAPALVNDDGELTDAVTHPVGCACETCEAMEAGA